MVIPRFVVWMLPVAAMVFGAAPVCGQNYPNKIIRIFAGPTGGTLDFGARVLAHEMSGPLGQQIIVENRGIAGIEAASKSPPDGYILVYYTTPLWLTPFLRSAATWDPVKDFVPISMTDQAPLFVVIHPSLPVKSIKELISLAKARPGQLNYAQASSGSTAHLSAELFKTMANVNIVSIPYKGGGPSLNALMAGEVQIMFSPAGSSVPHIKSGRLKALAVTGAKRTMLYPDLPTVAASGLPGYEAVSFVGVVAPAGTPAAIVNRLNHEILQCLAKADVKERFLKMGVETIGSSPEQFAATIKEEIAKWGKLIKDTGIRAE